MIITIMQAIWFFLPAGFANMSPVVFSKVKFLGYPVDFNKKIKGKPIFGKNKTYRGFFFGTLVAILVTYVQSLFTVKYSIVDYSSVNLILLGFLLGFGALFGDLTESFFKRRLGIKPGGSWIPFDQIDWTLGAIVFAGFYVKIGIDIMVVALVLGIVIHILVNYLGYVLRFKKNKL